MITPVLTTPTDPDFLHVLNRRLEDLSTQIEALEAKAAAAAAAAAAAPATTTQPQTSAVGALISNQAGTRAQRRVYAVAQLDAGATWFETDTKLLYVVDNPTKEQHKWRYLAGTMTGTTAARPSS